MSTTWHGCYQDGWQDLIVQEAFAHPAKYSRGLIHRLYRHLLEQGYIRPGQTVCDPFGGVALGALDAMTYGLRWVGCELEPRFNDIANGLDCPGMTLAFYRRWYGRGQHNHRHFHLCPLCAERLASTYWTSKRPRRATTPPHRYIGNFDLWRRQYGFTGGTLLQGDSRQLRVVLAGAEAACVVGSPPFAQSTNGDTRPYGGLADVSQHGGVFYGVYGTTPGQLGALPPGDIAAVVGSPPWENQLGNHDTSANYDALKAKMIRDGHSNAGHRGASFGADYGTAPGQLGNTTGDTFWTAASAIVTECAALLPVGGITCWVVKDYVKNKQRVPFCDQWRQLCERHGFVLVEEIHASLVEEHGEQGMLFGTASDIATAIKEGRAYESSATGKTFLGQATTTERKGFFRRLAEKKGSPRIDYETVLILRRSTP